MMGERYIEREKAISLCFIDMEKTFDRVRWDILMDILKLKKVYWKGRRLIKELCMKQKSTKKIKEGLTDWFETGLLSITNLVHNLHREHDM